MKKSFKLGLSLTVLAVALTGCTKVTQNDIGLRVHLLGDSKGSVELLKPGRYYESPNTDIVTFPTAMQNVVWTRSKTEGSPTDQSITMQTSDGLVVGADIGLSFQVDPSKAVTLYRTYRHGIGEIQDIYLRNMVRDAFNEVASTMTVEQMYGKDKPLLMAQVTAMVRKEVGPVGIKVDKISIIGHMRFPDSVNAAIEAKVKAIQKAETRKNEEAEAKAAYNIAQTNAQSKRDAKITEAAGDAQAINIKAKALRSNPEIIQLMAVEKWDGKTPLFMGSGKGQSVVPFANVPISALKK